MEFNCVQHVHILLADDDYDYKEVATGYMSGTRR